MFRLRVARSAREELYHRLLCLQEVIWNETVGFDQHELTTEIQGLDGKLFLEWLRSLYRSVAPELSPLVCPLSIVVIVLSHHLCKQKFHPSRSLNFQHLLKLELCF